ncbi:MAG: thioredoxin domain-containing protein [Mycobacteriales bacterium]
MVRTITILHTPGCPNVALLRQRLADALTRFPGPAPLLTVEEVAGPDEAGRRGFHGSPALLVDGVDPFAGPETPPAFACRTYRTETGVEGAPSVDQIVAALTVG